MHSLYDATWRHSDARATVQGGREDARRILESFTPPDEAQRVERDRILSFLDEHENALERACIPGHLTASALLLDASGQRGLLTLHRKLGRWLQLGGHCDGDGNLVAVALRELQEESGIEEIRIHPAPIDVDIHVIPARKDEPEHLHLDTRFVAFAPEGAQEVVSEESIELAWFGKDELDGLKSDASVRRLFDRTLR